jgi:thermitase
MKPRLVIAALAALSFLVGAADAATVAKGAGKGKPVTGPAPSSQSPRFVEGQVVVGFSPGAAAAARADAHAQAGGRLIRSLPQLNVDLVSVPAGAVPGSIAAYRSNPSVRYAEPNYLRRLTGLPNEGSEPWPYGGTINFMTEQWGLHNTGQALFYDQFSGDLGAIKGTADADIDFAEAWDRLLGKPIDQTIVIAVLDSGVDCSHEDLKEKCVNQQLFSPSEFGQADIIGHGTHVAGTAAASTNNSRGTASVGWNARIADLKVCYEEIDYFFGFITGLCADFDIARGLTYAADRLYHVANMSLAGPDPSVIVSDAVNYAIARGMLIGAGAGNA